MDELVSPLGLTPEMVAAEMRRKLFDLIDQPESEFTIEKKSLWREGSALLFVIVNQLLAGQQVEASRIARQFAAQVDKDSKTNIPLVVWNAVTRFGMNLISAGSAKEPEDTREELQAELAEARAFNWKEWIKKQLEGAKT